MQTVKTMTALIESVECGEFEFHVRVDNQRPYLQIQSADTCTVTGLPYHWHGRKWFLSPHMTDSEIVQTAWAAAKMAMEHELRETFKWEGECIFRPHFDIRALHEISRANRVDERTTPESQPVVESDSDLPMFLRRQAQ